MIESGIYFFINSLWIFGVFAMTDSDSLFGFAQKLELPGWIRKPLFDCPYCMASVHGSAFFMLVLDLPVKYLPFYVVCLCGLNYIILRSFTQNQNEAETSDNT